MANSFVPFALRKITPEYQPGECTHVVLEVDCLYRPQKSYVLEMVIPDSEPVPTEIIHAWMQEIFRVGRSSHAQP